MYNLRKQLIIEKTKYKVFAIDYYKDNLDGLEDKRFFNLSLGRIYSDNNIIDEDISNYDYKERYKANERKGERTLKVVLHYYF
jgi:hypothetical protein